MSYRNDHEAALHRVQALEDEVARLRTAATASTPTPATKPRRRSSRHYLARAGLATVLVGASVMAIVSRDRPTAVAAPSAPTAPIRAAAIPESLAPLRDCVAQIAPLTTTLDATTTDPRGAGGAIDEIARTGASCRRELAAYAGVELDPAVRDQLRRWSTAEDTLANEISMLAVYYGDDPYGLDNYASAPQLWREYHRARIARDDALGELTLTLDRSTATR